MAGESNLDRRSRGYGKTGGEWLASLHPGPKAILIGVSLMASGTLLGFILNFIGLPSISASTAKVASFMIACLVSGISGAAGLAWIILSAPKIVDWLKTGVWSRRLGATFFFFATFIPVGCLIFYTYAAATGQTRFHIIVFSGLIVGSILCFGCYRTLRRAGHSAKSDTEF